MFTFFERIIDPVADHPIVMPPTSLLAFYWHYIRQGLSQLLWLLLIGFLTSLVDIIVLRFLGSLIDLLRSTEPENFRREHGAVLSVMAVLILIARPLLTCLHDLLTQQALAPSMTNLIRWQMHRYVSRQTYGFFTNDAIGRIASKIIQTGPALRESTVQIVDAVWVIVTFTIGSFVVLVEVDLLLAIPLVLWLIAYAFSLYYFVPKIRWRAAEMSEMRAVLTGRIVDSYANVLTVKLFSHPKREDDFASETFLGHNAAYQRETRLLTKMNVSVACLNAFLVAGTGGLALVLWVGRGVTIGDIALAAGLASRLTTMAGWVMWTSISIFENVGVVQEGMTSIARPNLLVDHPDANPLVLKAGAISFSDVRFGYEPSRLVLDALCLDIKGGEKVGIVGRSGAGKTTLINLLLRLYDVQAGSIMIDGQNISAITQDSLRQQISVVAQEVSLLNRSVMDNILYGRPGASAAEVVNAAKKAHAHEFILDLVDSHGRVGYEAFVGERGVKLSGGQRQRIAIARIILKDAPVLILDEATSALDSEVEAAIQENLHPMMDGKTVIAIAHRLSTIALMDRLMVLDGGQISESGTHEDLLEIKGLYSVLWHRQSGGFLKLEIPKGDRRLS